MAADRVSLPHVRALDGIRGLALCAILLYHSDHLVGGFISVDMFFALSGFLITSLLLREWDRSGTVSVGNFWARRARRLLPALALLMVGIAAYAAFFAEPSELSRIRGDSLATILYVANWHAIFTNASYFDVFATPSPLRHAWTLAVEEQFYLFWPVAFAVIVKWRKHLTPNALLKTAIVGMLTSGLIMALVYDSADPNRAYYGTDSRAYAVFAGIGAAAVVARWGHARTATSRRALEVGAFVALAFLAVVWNQLEAQSPEMYYGGFFAVAMAMVVILLSAANPQPGPMNRFLSFRGFVLLGTISYGVYLWHWPINLVLDPERTGIERWPLFVVRTAVAIAFGTVSYLVVEQPIRNGAGSARTWWIATPTVAVTVVGLLVIATVGATTAPPPVAGPTNYSAPDMMRRRDIVDAVIPGSTPRIVMAGDSVALSLQAGAPITRTAPLALQSAAILGCGIARGVPLGIQRFNPAAVCEAWPKIWRRAIRVFRPSAVVLLTGAWDAQDRLIDDHTVRRRSAALRRHIEARLRLAVRIVSQAGIPLVLVTTPCFPGKSSGTTEQSDRLVDAAGIAWFDRIERSFAAAHPGDVHLVDLAPYLCPDGKPRDALAGVSLYSDGVHFTTEGAARVWAWLAPQLLRVMGDSPTLSSLTGRVVGAPDR